MQRKRVKKDRYIQFRIDEGMLESIKKASVESGTGQSEYIRQAVKDKIRRERK